MILVFGSINADLVFETASLPQPGETMLTAAYAFHPGGKGANQAVAAARAGARVFFFGAVGPDGFAAPVVDALKASGVNVDGIVRSATPTGLATIAVDRAGENQILVASGANLTVRADLVPERLLTPQTLLVLQMEVPEREVVALTTRARLGGARVLLNLAPARKIDPGILDRTDWLVVNKGEAAVLAGEAGRPLALARNLARRHKLACIVTLGAEGAIAVFGDEAWSVGSLPVRAVDTVGAGDAFVGAFAAALDRGASLDQALHRASVAAGLACEGKGAQSAMPLDMDIDARMAALAPPVRID